MLAVVYLIFNEGYGGRGDLAAEAIRLGRLLAELMPDEPEVHGLLALMLLHDARRAARFAGDELVLLADQDRSLWDAAQIARARALLDRALALRGRGPYVLQAAIASLQAEDRDRLAAGRRALRRARPRSPARRWSSSTAPSRWPRPARPRRHWRIVDALALDELPLPALDPRRAAAPLGRTDEARAALPARARARAGPSAERRFLERRLAEL